MEINKFAEEANSYRFGMVAANTGGIYTSSLFAKVNVGYDSVHFEESNSVDSAVSFKKEDLQSIINGKDENGMLCYIITLKTGTEVKVIVWGQKSEDEIADDKRESLSIDEIQKWVENAKTINVKVFSHGISTSSIYDAATLTETDEGADLFFKNNIDSITVHIAEDGYNQIFIVSVSERLVILDIKPSGMPYTIIKIALSL